EGEVDGYIVHFNESLFTTFLQDGQYLERFHFFSGSSEEGVCELSPSVLDKAVMLFESMLGEVAEPDVYQLDMIRVKLLEFFILVERSDTGSKGQPFPPQKLALLRNFKQLIDKQFRQLKLPKAYAEQLHVTPNHLNAVCQELVGETAGDLIRDRVILEAKRLLVNADLTITGIAYELNFADGSYFTKFFRKHAGMTPEEFRRGAG
ncbi:MAG TPA: helix-turn-helix domain-containing protein, partial [Puia sp.]|nr:helix-turn-helix domain-containing protein [Puia sp.]